MQINEKKWAQNTPKNPFFHGSLMSRMGLRYHKPRFSKKINFQKPQKPIFWYSELAASFIVLCESVVFWFGYLVFFHISIFWFPISPTRPICQLTQIIWTDIIPSARAVGPGFGEISINFNFFSFFSFFVFAHFSQLYILCRLRKR